VHGIGGEVLSYGLLARHLGTDQPIYGLRAQTRPEHGVWPTVEEMAARYIAAIRRLKTAGPYRIGGYSGGGLVAYEMARQLMESGDGMALLVMLDRGNPRGQRPKLSLLTRLARLPLRTAHWLVDDDLLRGGLRNAIGRSHSKLVRWRGAALQRVAGDEAAAIDIRHELGVWRFPEESREFLTNLSRALRSYRPGPYTGPMLVLRARSGRLLSTAIPTPDLGWRELVSGELRSEVIPGAHDTIMMEPRIRHLAEALGRHLDKARD
jgi:thioesterase domain-containing protein